MELWNRYTDTIKWRLLSKLPCSDTKTLRSVKYLFDHKEYDDFTERDKKLLRKVGIINGVGPYSILKYCKLLGKFTTLVFFLVDYQRHDVYYFVGGTEHDRKKSDDGLLKYSLLSVVAMMQKLGFKRNIFLNLLLVFVFTILGAAYTLILSPFMVLVFFAYFMVRAFG